RESKPDCIFQMNSRRTNVFQFAQHPHRTYFRRAGWSSLVARQAHNLKVAGSNPAPATNFSANCGGLSRLRHPKSRGKILHRFIRRYRPQNKSAQCGSLQMDSREGTLDIDMAERRDESLIGSKT